jgi:hypothetical protein
MCSNCIGSGYLIPHDASKCPFKSSLHCSHCATYGHTLETCGDRPAAVYSTLTYVEQLIPLADIERFGITSRTPLPSAAATTPFSPYPDTKGCIEVLNDPKIMREFLVARGIKPSSKTLVTQLQEFAKREGRRLILIPRPEVDGKAKVEAYVEEAVHAAAAAPHTT